MAEAHMQIKHKQNNKAGKGKQTIQVKKSCKSAE
jgi:hypothetical protein